MSDQAILAIGLVSLLALAVSLKEKNWNLMSISLVVMSASAIAFVYRFLGGV